MHKLIKDLEIPASGIELTRTDKTHDGDHRLDFIIGCSSCGSKVAISPSCEQLTHASIIIARNDANNPRYHIGFKYMWRYQNICFRENSLEYAKNLKSQILSEEYNSQKMQQLLELRQQVLS